MTRSTRRTAEVHRTRGASAPRVAAALRAGGGRATRLSRVSADLLLGLDLGTTSCKAAVVTPDGEEVAHGQAPLGWTTVPTGAEIAPAGFVECALVAAREALAAAPQGRVAALGVSSMA